MSDQPPPRYKVNDVVWVKFRSMWWPGVVCDVAQVPPQNLRQLRRPPFAVVRFFGERTFEFIKNPNGILPYRCPQKFDFIKKGLALFRKDYGYANKFPSDVQLAEKRTGGDARIFERDDEFTLHPIDAKTAKLLAQQRAERGLPMPGEGDTASLSELSTLTPPDAPPDPLDTSGSEYSQSYYGPDDDSTYHEDSVRDEMESERTEKEKEKVEKERERAAKEREWMERKRDRAAKERERVEKERERAEMEILSAQMEIEVPPEERRMRLRAEIPFTEEEIKEVREINKVIDSMDLAEQMRLLGQIQLREEMRRKQMEAQAREHPQEYSLPHHYDEFTNVLGSVRAMSLPSMPKGVKVYECSHHPEHARVQSELVHGIRSNKSLSPTSAYRQEYEAQQNYNQFVPLVDSVPSTSRASMPSTSRGFKGQDHLKYQDPMPSTSKTPSSSRASVPATSRSSMQSNSRLSLPSTSRASMPSTSRESIQSPPRLPMPSTSRQAISSSTINCECPDHKAHVTFKLPVSPTSSPPNSSQPRPSTSREPMPSTSRKSTSPKSREQIPSTSRRESKSTSRASTSTSKAPKSMGELEEIFSRVPYQEAREYKQSISDIYKLLQSPRHHGRHAPLRGYIPPVAAQERKPTPGKKTSPSSDTKKKRGRKKKNVFGPPAPGTSRLKGESHIHDMDIYRDIEERMAAMPDYTDPNTPLPLYLRPESIRRPKKPVPPGMPPSNKMHPIPEKEGIYKCHLCKYSCGRVNNIISHIKLHNYGKNINDIIRKNYLNYIKRLTLDEKEIITVRDSSDEEEEEKEEGEGEEEEDTVPLEDEALSFSNTRIICDPEPDTPRRRMRPKSPIRNLFKMQIIPVYSKVESQNKKLPTTSRDALLQTRAAINKSKRSTLPIETRTEQFPVNRDLPSTSRAAQSPQPSTSKAATPQSPMPSTSKSATTQFSSHSGENRDNEGSTSSSSSEPELFLDKVWRMIPQQFLEAEQRTMIRMPPIPLVNIPIRRPCIQSDPVRYLHSWQRLPGLPNSLHYLPKAPKFTLPFPILIPYKRKLPQDQLPQSKKFQQTPQQSQRLAGKKRSYQDITKQKTDNENVREILKDWDDDDTTNNPIPSTSTQNLSEEQHPIRLEDAVGMLHQMHEEKKSNDDDDESPQRKVRNIPKKDRNRPPDDEPEKPNDNVLIIEDIQIIPPETKCIDQQPSTSKETDKEDNNSANEMETEVNVTNDDNTEIKCMSDSKDENIEVINTETDENIEDINTETDDHEEKLVS